MTKLDDLYSSLDKSNYFLGTVTKVFDSNILVQVENLTLLSYKNILGETLTPSTINYFVIVEGDNGIFLGEVLQNSISTSDLTHFKLNSGNRTEIFSELLIDIIGFMPRGENIFELPGFKTAGLTNKVYIANKKSINLFIQSIEIKNINPESKLKAFSSYNVGEKNIEIEFQPRTLLDRHLMVLGSTNSGKSTSALSIIDKLLLKETRLLMIDPTGEYSNSFDNKNVDKYTLGEDIFLGVGEISMTYWNLIFETNDSSQPATLYDAIQSLRYQKKAGVNDILEKHKKKLSDIENKMNELTDENLDFDLSLLPKQIRNETRQVNRYDNTTLELSSFTFNQQQFLAQKVESKLATSSMVKFFNTEKGNLLQKIDEFMQSTSKSLYLDFSKINSSDELSTVIIDLICKKILDTKVEDIVPFSIFIDEIHRYTKNIDGQLVSTGLTNIAREGRKKGIFLFLTTQSPKDVEETLFNQIGTFVIHRLTAHDEINVVRNHVSKRYLPLIPKLNTGEAIISSINLLRSIPVKFLASNRHHYNTTPSLLRKRNE